MSAEPFAASCPVPHADDERILLAHGGGGRLTQQLIERLFLPAFDNAALGARHDAAEFVSGNARLALTTDAYVVRPLFFPGGDIGALAVNGTVNDLAMAGARPLWMSAAFIIEEGLPLETLERIVASMRSAAARAGVQIITGDTKVVDKGKADGVFITTSGVGSIEHTLEIRPSAVRPGDAVLISGDIGRHGIAVISAREGLEFESTIESDCAPLAAQVLALIEAGIEVHCLRDLTRGGLASALNEIAQAAGVRIEIDERAVPVAEGVHGACEILGFDPFYVACEGRFVAFVKEKDAERALKTMRANAGGEGAEHVGCVSAGPAGIVTLSTRIGATRVLDMLSGEQLPRIC